MGRVLLQLPPGQPPLLGLVATCRPRHTLGCSQKPKDKVGPSTQERGWEELREELLNTTQQSFGLAQLSGVAGMQAPDLAIRGSTQEATSGHCPFLPLVPGLQKAGHKPR